MLKDRKAYEDELDAQLARWEADIDVLKAKAKRATVDARIQYDKAIEGMEHQHQRAKVHLHDLRNATDDAWASVKEATEKVWTEVKALFGSAEGKN